MNSATLTTLAKESATVDETAGTKVKEILMLHHSHLDVGYTHSQPILWELQNEYIDEAIDWLERTADLPEGVRPKWTCEATEPVLRWLRRAAEPDRQRFHALVASGRIGLAALRWHVGAAIDRPALERLVAGKRELEDLTGAPIRVACQHDVNGVPWAMADVLIDAGVDLFVMAVNIHLGNALQPRPGMFLWEAPSGRTIRVFNGHHYTMFDQLMLSWHDSVDKMAEGWAGLAQRLEDIDYGLDFVYLTSTAAPVMWDNAPPNPFMPDLLARWNAADRGPAVRYATFDDLRDRVMQVPDETLPRWRGDWTDYWSFGYGSTPIATALNQRAKPLATAAATLTEAPHPVLAQALEKIDLFDEHTWGYYITSPEHPQSQTGDILKQAYAHEGHELASFAVMDGLERLAGNPVADKGIKGVLLCNPTPHPVSIRPTVPADWFRTDTPETERTARAGRMFHHNRSWGREFPGTDARGFGAIELPANSWRSIPLSELPPAPLEPSVSHSVETSHIQRRELNFAATNSNIRRIGRIESPFHTLTYDAANGKILSLVDRVQDRELLAPRPGMDFFSFVRERPDELDEGSRHAYYESNLDLEKYDVSCWQDWQPVREHATRVVSTAVNESHDRVTLERVFEAPGATRFVQRVSLLADDPVVHLEIELELETNPNPQGFYLTLPLALKPDWQAAYDTAGDLITLDDDQLPGACRGWVTAESMSTMWDDETAVALFLPDAPGVQFGDFHFGPPLTSVPRPKDPLLLAWPVNNYWSTNFPQVQSGRMNFRYGFMSLPADERDELTRHAASFRQPPLVWPITTGGRDAGSGPLPGLR
jgi:hypothetical protein